MVDIVQLAYGSGAVVGRPVVVTTTNALPTVLYDGGGTAITTAGADNLAGTAILAVASMLYDGTTWDRPKGALAGSNLTGTIPAAGLYLSDGTNWARWLTASVIGDAQSGAFQPTSVAYNYNGSTYDRAYNNTEGTLLASAARTATTSSADQTNYNAKGVRIFINATASAATPSVVFTVEVKDPVSATYTAVATSAAITGAGHTVVTVYPGITTAANVSIAHVLGRTWRVTATAADADSLTYSVGYSYIL